jgi:hypothetical protein
MASTISLREWDKKQFQGHESRQHVFAGSAAKIYLTIGENDHLQTSGLSGY